MLDDSIFANVKPEDVKAFKTALAAVKWPKTASFETGVWTFLAFVAAYFHHRNLSHEEMIMECSNALLFLYEDHGDRLAQRRAQTEQTDPL